LFNTAVKMKNDLFKLFLGLLSVNSHYFHLMKINA
jgi:hypothetical protein